MSDNHKNDESNLPVPVDDDFDAGGNRDRLIQGTILRCVDGHWSGRDGVSYSTGTEMLVLGTTQALQHWRDGTKALLRHCAERRPGDSGGIDGRPSRE